MPELPEVETTRRGLEPHLVGRKVADVVVRQRALRWPVPRDLGKQLRGATIRSLARRGKYLLIDCGHGCLIVHLGMSGRLRVMAGDTPPGKHDHFDLVLDSGNIARLRDPRRFGAVLWVRGDPLSHRLLRGLGPEPLHDSFSTRWLRDKLHGRAAPIKSLLMDSSVVTGVGNIYANEALFRAGIHPARAAGRVGPARLERLVVAVRDTLRLAIDAGGSTLRDFLGADGAPGYFQQQYLVYGRAGQPCTRCATPIRVLRQGQRSTFYCPRCQR